MANLIGNLLDYAAAAAPARIAASIEEDTVTYRTLDDRTGRLANVLAGIGVARGDRVLVWIGLSLRCHELFFACARIGAVFVPVNPGGSANEVAAIARYINPRLIVVDRERLEVAEALADELSVQLGVVGATGARPGLDLDAAMGKAKDRYRGPAPEEEDPHVIFLTSGSTGLPKGVIVSHRAGMVRARSFATQSWSGGGGDVNMFPLFHMAGWTNFTASMAHLRPNHHVRKADAPNILREVERWRARRLYCIPGVWDRILESTEHSDTSSLREILTGTYRVDPAVLAALSRRFPGTEREIVYGSTEVGIAITLGDGEIDTHPDCVGLPAPGVFARLGDEGELQISSPAMMTGYFDLPEGTADVLRDGWFSTGDLAEKLDDGVYRIVGRKREVIRSGGETVAPAEVEAALAGYPGLRRVAVVGLPDEQWGEVVCAAVVMEEGMSTPGCAALRAYLTGRLASFKHPRKVCSVTDIPMTSATGQLQRSRVRENVIALLGETIS